MSYIFLVWANLEADGPVQIQRGKVLREVKLDFLTYFNEHKKAYKTK